MIAVAFAAATMVVVAGAAAVEIARPSPYDRFEHAACLCRDITREGR